MVAAQAMDPIGDIVGAGGVLAQVVVGVMVLDHLVGPLTGLARVLDMVPGMVVVVEPMVEAVAVAVEVVLVVVEGRTTMAEIRAASS